MCLHVGWLRWKLKRRWIQYVSGYIFAYIIILSVEYLRALCIYACSKLALCMHNVCVCVLCNWFVILLNIDLFSLTRYAISFSFSFRFLLLNIIYINRIQTKPNRWMDTCESAILISDNEWQEKPTKYTYTRTLIFIYQTQMSECKAMNGKKSSKYECVPSAQKVFHIHAWIVDSK